MIPINRPIMGPEEVEAAREVIEGGLLTSPSAEGGPQVKEFEKELASFHGAKEAVAVTSGTSALLISLLALGVGPGDEVIVPSFTFVATASAVMILGAKPIFVDIDPRTYNIDPGEVRRAMTKKTKAVIPVDLYGLPAEMDEINETAEGEGIGVIEDACQAQGARYRGRMAATLGRVGCLSFYPGKVMTTGEGGAIITNDVGLAERMRSLRTHGQVKGYDPVAVGGNFRMPEVEAAIGRVQLRRLPAFLEERRRNAERLTSALANLEADLPFVPAGSRHNWYLYTVGFQGRKERDAIKHALNAAGYGATVYYPTPVHRTPLYSQLGYATAGLKNTDAAAERVLSIPVNPLVKGDDIEAMARVIKKVL